MVVVRLAMDAMLERVMHDPDVMRAAAEEAKEEAKKAEQSVRNARAARVRAALRRVRERKLARTARRRRLPEPGCSSTYSIAVSFEPEDLHDGPRKQATRLAPRLCHSRSAA